MENLIMITLTDHLLMTAPGLDSIFRDAVDQASADTSRHMRASKPRDAYATLARARGRHGFVATPTFLLTPPDANAKLDKAVVPSYGLTLASFRSVLPATTTDRRLAVNACPNAGHCVKVCVLKNGNGRYDSVTRAWAWRTDLVARHPEAFARILAWELVRAVRKHGAILFRPNVNSDVAWQTILPSLCDGYIDGVTSYGYSKVPETLDSDGWLGSAYRVAYSWNERSDPEAVSAFLRRGGSVAVVTSRRKGSAVIRELPFDGHDSVSDADKTDEWMFASSMVGDLSAKGEARRLIGRSGFVVAAAS